ncbi:GrpB family protein [[Phormidium] sp. ETS-05]|uniref:GrpB family protein n=1 Tax=[Phormidium] sp. ETS-05 TaxID=222819 RepID=UPI0018EF126B|nr:GrpB family protein [[Phormidium] sp. ETS-05]
MKRVAVVPHDPQWADAFAVESQQIADALGENVVAIHHIGSTAIPMIYAKPIIDLLVEVKDINQVNQQNSTLESLGYEVMGEFGIPGRRYFRKNNPAGMRTHHVHIFEVGSPQVERHLNFRDYMIAHPEAAQKYSDLKQELGQKYPNDIEKYMDGKDGFIQEIDQKAARWRLGQMTP